MNQIIPDCTLFKVKSVNNHYVFLPVPSKYIVLSRRTEVKGWWMHAIEGITQNLHNVAEKLLNLLRIHSRMNGQCEHNYSELPF